MRSKLFREKAETVKTAAGRWVRVFPKEENVYGLYDLLGGVYLGQILFDAEDYWIYDGNQLDVDEQEEIAACLTGSKKEMEDLLNSINELGKDS